MITPMDQRSQDLSYMRFSTSGAMSVVVLFWGIVGGLVESDGLGTGLYFVQYMSGTYVQ